MSEETILATPETTETPAATPNAEATPVDTDQAAPKGETPAEVEAPSTDWRDKFSGGDAERRKALERYTDEAAYDKAFRETQAMARDPKRVLIPGADADDDVKSNFAKAVGIPETPDDYKIDLGLGDGEQLADAEMAEVKSIAKMLHEKGGVNAHPDVVNAASQIYVAMSKEAQARQMAAAETAQAEAKAALEQVWTTPAEFKENVGFAQAGITKFFGEESADLLNMQFADGSKLGDRPEFVRAFAEIGRQFGEDPHITEIISRGGNASEAGLKERHAEIMSWYSTDQKKYFQPHVQEELTKLNNILGKE